MILIFRPRSPSLRGYMVGHIFVGEVYNLCPEIRNEGQLYDGISDSLVAVLRSRVSWVLSEGPVDHNLNYEYSLMVVVRGIKFMKLLKQYMVRE